MHRIGEVMRTGHARSAEIGKAALVHTVHTPTRDGDE
jgi:hypothetical protein